MDLNMTDLFFYGNESMPNNDKGNNFGHTAVQLNCFAFFSEENAGSIGDSCGKEHPPQDDGCMLMLGLGSCQNPYGSNHFLAAANISKECAPHAKLRLCDSSLLQLALPQETRETKKHKEQSDLSLALADRHLYSSTRNPFLSVLDEGSTNGGGFMPSLLVPTRHGNPCINTDTPETVQLQNDNHQGPDPSATTDCSIASLADPAVDTVHHPRTRVHHPKKCMFKGCSKGARGASGLCIAHGGGQRCHKPGCNKGAESRTAFCKAHGGGRRCETLGCTKSAEGRTDFCIAHGGGRRCKHEGCTKAARGKSGLCIRHGGGKRCTIEGCTRSAEGQVGLCISHGGGRRCQYPGCNKGAQGSTMNCKAHGGGRRCIVKGCTKGAEGSTPLCKGHGGGKRCLHEGGGVCTKSVHGGTDYCVAHGGGKRCVVPGCTKSARGRTDCCVKHGGGKRCRHEGCGKSAQGSTDFCKAHGGGKRCSWADGCDKFARGKSRLCAAHGNKVARGEAHASFAPEQLLYSLGSGNSGDHDDSSGASSSSSECCRGVYPQIPHVLVPSLMKSQFVAELEGERSNNSDSERHVVPEGRVHGGGLLSLLGGNFHGANIIVGDDD